MPLPKLNQQKIRPPQHWRDAAKAKLAGPTDNLGRGGIKISKRLLKRLAISAGVLILLFLAYAIYLTSSLPSPGKLMERQVAESTKIYDRTCETLLYEVHGDQKRTLVDLQNIPDNVKHATISIEDKNFYKHSGFSFWAIMRTAANDLITGKRAGGSTLTQQFIKNAVLSNEKTITRKLKELILAYRLEQKFSKDQILQMYLNEVPYGSNAYGVEAASQFYFGKSVKDVTLPEAAVMAALLQSPTRYSPYGPNKDLLLERQRYVLGLMAEQGYISQEEAEQAKSTELKFQKRIENIAAPHFVMYIKELVAEKYGEQTAEQGGLKICTTLDADKQKAAEDAVAKQSETNAAKYGANNAALVAMDAKTGEVLAMVGSRDYFNDEIDGQFNVALAPRQPGSSFKPVVYTAAFLKGFLPETMVYDAPTNFSTDASKPYEPQNYDGQNHGPISFRQALAGSLNVPAVKALYLAGIDNVLELAKKMGYTSFGDKDRYGLTLVLGGGEVKLLEHVHAYSVFAQDGKLPPVVFIRKIEDAKGKVLEEYKEDDNKPEQVLDANVARMTASVMSDNASRAYVFGAQNRLTLPDRPVAAKTGTTNDYRDAWTIGYTPSLVAGVWVGNSDNGKMKAGADGSIVAAPIWNAFMRAAAAAAPVESFTGYSVPENTRSILLGENFAAKKVKIDKASGLLATDQTPPEMIEEKTYAQPHDLLYFVNKSNPNGDAPSDPSTDPQFLNWEKGVNAWIEAKKAKDPSFLTAEPPQESDNIHTPGNRPSFNVFNFQSGQVIGSEPLNINIGATAPRGVALVEYYINDNLFTANSQWPYGLNRSLSALNNGDYKLTIKVCDDVYNCSTQDFNFTLNLSGNSSLNRNFSVSWAGPAKGSSFSAAALPLMLKVNLMNPENIAALNFNYQDKTGEHFMGTKKMVRNDIEAFAWAFDKAWAPGAYTVWAEAVGWNNEKQLSEKIDLVYQPE